MPRILLVNDERSMRNTLAEFIREHGHNVCTAEDATQALEVLREKQPLVVVTDIILPRMTGVKLLKRNKEASPDTQVVMITGEPTAAEAVRLGAFDYLSKPIVRTGFMATITSALRVSVEDYSQTKALLEEIKTRSLDEGIDDLETYLYAHPDDVAECIRTIRITDVNQATLTMHNATSKEDLMSSLATVIVLEQSAKFIPQL